MLSHGKLHCECGCVGVLQYFVAASGDFVNQIVAAVLRPLMTFWFLVASTTWHDIPRPTGAPTAHASGSDPLRVLLIGCGPVVGYGALSHDLAAPGHLARQLGAISGRGVDVDLIADDKMTAATAIRDIEGASLGRYDGVVVMLGFVESLMSTSATAFRRDIDAFLSLVAARVSPGIPVIVTGIPTPPRLRMLTPMVARIVAAHAVVLDAEITAATQRYPDVYFQEFPVPPAEYGDRPAGPELYAVLVKEAISAVDARIDLSPKSVGVGAHDEDARQHALERMNVLGTQPDDRLTQITAMARRLFGTSIAAITFLDGDRQWFMAVDGYDVEYAPRDLSFCDHTVRGDGPFIVPDATLDPRFREHPLVAGGPKLIFYAGYPLVSTDGYRVGTFCLFDVNVRVFNSADIVLLRDLAMLVQDQIWAEQRALPR